MIKLYRYLKNCCQTYEWAAGLSAITLVALVKSAIYTVLIYHSTIVSWLFNNLLLHGLVLLIVIASLSTLIIVLMHLLYSQYNIAERTEKVFYRHRPGMVNESR